MPDGVEYEYENPVGSIEGGAAWNDIPMAPIEPLFRNERMNFQNLCNASCDHMIRLPLVMGPGSIGTRREGVRMAADVQPSQGSFPRTGISQALRS